nr:uncharacterized protein CFP56_24499 [Quercus suber]
MAHRSSALAVPPTQNTAPVLEFNCLYTHDLRRKQKRWQDGFLRYHTFNKRVMLYDLPRNFIGDMHWKESSLQEGDEMTLEKSAVLVQVAEEVGRTETDLTELRNSAKKSRGEGRISPIRSSVTSPRSVAPNANGSKQPCPMKHKPLNALLGSSKGPTGKSVIPLRSPYDVRYADAENQAWRDGRPPKRQRVDSSETEMAGLSRSKKPTLKPRTSAEAIHGKRTSPQLQQVRKIPVIDLRGGDEEAAADESLFHSSSSDPSQPMASPDCLGDRSAEKRSEICSGSLACHMQERSARKAKHCSAHVVSKASGIAVENSSSRSRMMNGHDATRRSQTKTEDVASRLAEAEEGATGHGQDPPEASLCISKSADTGFKLRLVPPPPRRKLLLCQDQLSTSGRRRGGTNSPLQLEPEEELRDRISDDEMSIQAQNQRWRLEERLARIGKKHLQRLPTRAFDDGRTDGAW